MTSNYPPGVTGSELEIAGPSWEGEIERECSAENVELVVINREQVEELSRLRGLILGGHITALGADPLRSVLVALVDVSMDACPFVGAVDAWAHGGVLHWTCPACGTEHEEDGRDGR